MKDTKHAVDDPNFKATSLVDFVRYYNLNIPEAFPRASLKSLHAFQLKYPSLFDATREWTIDKHRKRLMEWLPSYQVAT